MASVEAEGLDAAIKAMKAQAARMCDLTPVMKAFGRFIEKNVDYCFDKSQDWDGVPFPPLADSTIEKRIGNLSAANKLTKSGEMTKGAKELQEKLRAPGGIKPLVDTARARNSQHSIATQDACVWTAVGYIGYHFTGNVHLPQRNVSPFVFINSNNWRLHPRAKAKLDELVRKHVLGDSTSEAAE